LLQHGGVIDSREAVVEGLVSDLLVFELALDPLVAVEPDPDAPGREAADLGEAGAEVLVPDVEVVVVDEGAGPGRGVLPLDPGGLAAGPEDLGLLLGDPDEDDTLMVGGSEVGSGHRFLALTALEMDDGDVLRFGQPAYASHQVPGQLAQQGIARNLLSTVLAEEPSQLGGGLELRSVLVEEHPIETFVLEDHVLIE